MTSHLTRLDERPIAVAAGSHSAFLVVRNEASRLPHVLDHHRALGVDRFFIVDNGSEDATVDLLLAQPDCHVFQTTDSFAAANYGMDWINVLVERHGIGSWCLFLDADELLTYPHAESMPLPEFCRFLDRSGAEGVFAVMVDMYSRAPISQATYEPGRPFLETCPHFDSDYRIRRKVGVGMSAAGFAEIEAVGGPRLRRFYPEFIGVGPWRMVVHRGLRRLRRHPWAHAIGLDRTRIGAALPPELTKVPLIKAAPGRNWVSNHRSTPCRLAEVTAALLHFKFFSDFHERAIREAARGQHWDGAAEYARYSDLLAREPLTSLYHAGSATFRSSDDLVRLGIMRGSQELDGFLGRAGPASRPPAFAWEGIPASVGGDR